MHRRTLLRAGAVGATGSLAGCTARVTGWSSLQVIATSRLDTAVRLTLTVFVNGERAGERQVGLDPNGTRRFEMAVDVPYGATLLYRATRDDAAEPKEFETEASVPLWGGNKCTFEPVVEISEERWSVGPACVA